MIKIIGEPPKQQQLQRGDDNDDDIEDANGPRKIQAGDTILMDLVGRQANSPQHLDGSIFQDVKGWLVTIGEPSCLIRALDSGFSAGLIHEGQTALIYTSNQYYYPHLLQQKENQRGDDDKVGEDEGATTKKPAFIRTYKDYSLPADSHMIFTLTANKIVMDTSRLNPYFPIQRSLTMKAIANDIYGHEWCAGGPARERSIKLYEKSAKVMHTLLQGTYFASVEPNHPQRKQCQEIEIDCLNNVMAVYMRAKRYSKAREAAYGVFKEDSKNVKAALRLAKSSMLDSEQTLDDKDQALTKAENIITYKDNKEETELRKLRAQWKKKQHQE